MENKKNQKSELLCTCGKPLIDVEEYRSAEPCCKKTWEEWYRNMVQETLAEATKNMLANAFNSES